MGKNKFNLSFKWVGAATWVLYVDDVKIACDPVLCPKDTVQSYAWGMKGKRRTEPAYVEADFQNIDLWLITHNHEDHLDQRGLMVIDPKATIVTHKNARSLLLPIHPQKLASIEWGQTVIYKMKELLIQIEAIPAVHASNSFVALLSGGGNGYWLNFKKEQSQLDIYVTGDTVAHEKVLYALKNRNVDILIPFMGAAFKNIFGGPLTLTAEGLRALVHSLKPAVILPVHFGTFSHYLEPISLVEDLSDNRVKIIKEGQTHTFSR